MASGGEKNVDFYAVLGLRKDCSDADLRNAYKKLALRWHPDRCSASGKSEFAKEAKEKFQAIQEAYSILSDSNKRFLYDMGVYDRDDDENEMGDFLDEMVQMMSQTKNNGNCPDSFEDLQHLFGVMFQADLDLSGFSHCSGLAGETMSFSSNVFCEPEASVSGGSGGKRHGSVLSSVAGRAKVDEFDADSASFCCGSYDQPLGGRVGGGGGRRNSRKQKASQKHDISKDTGISA
ncbi:Chaperone protein dnaJ 49 [Platanthera guangdongensis]|uniref:Chaperone protein dnaJ 49 n=1 Tax=Platanthera guangdongensis TaxID=2320717 RepID=A0ABR2LIL6_9ASPA